jgi:hypothetical protein
VALNLCLRIVHHSIKIGTPGGTSPKTSPPVLHMNIICKIVQQRHQDLEICLRHSAGDFQLLMLLMSMVMLMVMLMAMLCLKEKWIE